jgi:gas vesicle structural protein
VALEPTRDHGESLADVIDAVLDKGLVINADIMVSLAGVELLGIKVRAALASFETAARYGLEFPSGTDLQAPGWREAALGYERCPGCDGRFADRAQLLGTGCPACGWQRHQAPALSPEAPGPIAVR